MAMRPHERRAAGAYPYYRLAAWVERNFAFKDDPKPEPTAAAAKAKAKRPGKYRVTEVTEAGARVLEDFVV